MRNSTGTEPSTKIPGWFMGVVTLPILLGLIWFGQGFLIPLVIAALLVILISALTQRIDDATILGWSPPRWMAYLISGGLVLALSFMIGAAVSGQASEISAAVPRYVERANDLTARLQALVGDRIMQSILDAMTKFDFGAFISEVLGAASGLVGILGLVLLYVAFMLSERGAFWKKLPKLFNTEAKATHFSQVMHRISDGVQQYLWITTITSAMSATVAYIVFKIVGLDFAVTLAVLVFLLNFIPNIGSLLATTFPTLLALIQFDTLTPAVMIVVFYGGSDMIIGNVLQPAMQGKSLNMSTTMVMISLTFWGTMWGIVGAFMAVPLMMLMMIVCAEFPALRPFAVLLSGDGDLDTMEEDKGTPLKSPEGSVANTATPGDSQ